MFGPARVGAEEGGLPERLTRAPGPSCARAGLRRPRLAKAGREPRPSTRHARWPGAFAFTLIELLLVVAIIGLLAAMRLAAMANSKAATKRVQCLSNLRQMAIAAIIYTDDHGDFYPIAYYYDAVNNGEYCWDFTTLEGNPDRVVPGVLWGGQGNPQIQQCPAFTGSANWLVDPYTGYNYNTSYIGHGQDESIPEPAKDSSVGHAARTALFGDGQCGDGADKFMRAPFPNPGDAGFWGRNFGTQGFRHLRRSNAAFCDGHAESLKGCYTTNSENSAVAPGTGFLSPSNSVYDVN